MILLMRYLALVKEKIKPYGKPEKKTRIGSVKTPMKLFEKKLGMQPKGTYRL